jgi:hypothetical protein
MVNSKQEEEKQFNFLDSEKRKILCKNMQVCVGQNGKNVVWKKLILFTSPGMPP